MNAEVEELRKRVQSLELQLQALTTLLNKEGVLLREEFKETVHALHEQDGD